MRKHVCKCCGRKRRLSTAGFGRHRHNPAAYAARLAKVLGSPFSLETPLSVTPTLNERAMRLADYVASSAAALRIAVQTTPAGARVIDCGIKTPGGLQAGLALARICLAGQAEVSLVPSDVAGVACPAVVVTSDHPVLACMASQYAGWAISVQEKFV